MIQWLNLVWFANVPSSSLLLADSFHTHTSSLTQKFMVSRGACLAIIPSACSHKLQPLNRGIKHKFKVTDTKILSILLILQYFFKTCDAHIQGVQRKWLQIQYSSCNHFLCTPCSTYVGDWHFFHVSFAACSRSLLFVSLFMTLEISAMLFVFLEEIETKGHFSVEIILRRKLLRLHWGKAKWELAALSGKSKLI